MFFFVSKIFWSLAQPLSLTILLLLAALVLAALRRRRLSASAVAVAALILALSSWTSLGAMLLVPLEQRFQRPAQLPDKVDGIIVLGGAFEGRVNAVRHGYELSRAGDRYVEAAVLARRFPQARILVSGGNGAMATTAEADADTAPRLFSALGIEPGRLLLENRSRDTYENAVFSRALVEPKPGETWLLVTSAFHMPRAMGLFAKVGFPVIPWPSDYRTTGVAQFGLFTDIPDDAVDDTTIALREWIGLMAYWLSGRIDSPFPSPSDMTPSRPVE